MRIWKRSRGLQNLTQHLFFHIARSSSPRPPCTADVASSLQICVLRFRSVPRTSDQAPNKCTKTPVQDSDKFKTLFHSRLCCFCVPVYIFARKNLVRPKLKKLILTFALLRRRVSAADRAESEALERVSEDSARRGCRSTRGRCQPQSVDLVRRLPLSVGAHTKHRALQSEWMC